MTEEPKPKNVDAVRLGKLGRGVPKTLSAEQREKRRQAMIQINQRRKALSTITAEGNQQHPTENDK